MATRETSKRPAATDEERQRAEYCMRFASAVQRMVEAETSLSIYAGITELVAAGDPRVLTDPGESEGLRLKYQSDYDRAVLDASAVVLERIGEPMKRDHLEIFLSLAHAVAFASR